MAETENRQKEAANCSEIVDGKFVIGIDDTGVYLTVFPPTNGGAPVREPQVLNDLRLREIADFNRGLLVQTIRDMEGAPVKIADPPPPPPEPDVQVLVARDRMEANLQIDMPRNCRKPEIKEILEKIQQRGITFGMDMGAVQRALEQPGRRVVCASGKRPVNGRDASIQFHVDLENRGKPTELEDGSVDFKNLNLFTTVSQGQVLAEKIPFTLGTPGTDVLGQPAFAKPGRDIPWPLGKNVEVNDNNQLVAAQPGHLLYENNKLNVVPVIEVRGDVDLSTGNVEFLGDVVIHGSVQTGFMVKAGGNVEIDGTVSGGSVEGKNIVIRMGVQGMFRGYIKAKENVTAKFIENANVFADQEVIVSDVILQSRICAGKRVRVEGRHGLIAGGSVAAGEEICAKIAGTHLAAATDLEVGVTPMLRAEYNALRKDIRKVDATLDQTTKGLAILRSMDVRRLPTEKQVMYHRLEQAEVQLKDQSASMHRRIEEIELSFEEMRYGKIRISDVVYPGVKITIGTSVKPIRETLKYVSLYAEDGEIKIGSYR